MWLSEKRNLGDNRGVIVPISLDIGKGSRRNYSKKKEMPTGIPELEKIIKDNKKDQKYINTNLSKILSTPDMLILAYERIKSNPGNMTEGVDAETLDKINKDWFKKIAKEIATGEFKFKASRRIQIPKSKGGMRSLGIPSPRDKIVQEGMRILLEAVFEPTFLPTSHGFRTGHSPHTALNWIRIKFGQMRWYIEGDISKCFDKLNHNLIINLINEKVKDQVFIDLIRKALKAGYINLGKYESSGKEGTPQGSLISPIICNIILHGLDEYMEKLKVEFDKGTKRKANPLYTKLIRVNKNDTTKDIEKRRKEIHKLNITVGDPKDTSFKRLVYVRYADDFLIGIIGSKKDCEEIRMKVKTFINENLKLELNMEKTKISNATTECAKFLGYKIFTTPENKKPYIKIKRGDEEKVVKSTTRPMMVVDTKELVNKLITKGFARKDGRPTRLGRLIHFEPAHIVQYYSSIIRGIINYYYLASNFWNLNRIYYILFYSCVLTLANKLKLRTMKKVIRKYGKLLTIKDNNGKILASIPPFEQPTIAQPMEMTISQMIDNLTRRVFRTKLLLDKSCYACGSTDKVEMHHVKHLRKAPKKGKDYLMDQMRAMNRKQLPLCQSCHIKVHKGIYNGPKL